MEETASNSTAQKSQTALCTNASDVVLGGGARVDVNGNTGGGPRNVALSASYPISGGWEAEAKETDGYNQAWSLEVYVICVPPSL